MKISCTSVTVSQLAADAVVVGHFADSPLAAAVAEVDKATSGAVSRLVERKEITGKHSELTAMLAPAGVVAGQVLVVGLGKKADFDRGAAFRAAAAAAKQLSGK